MSETSFVTNEFNKNRKFLPEKYRIKTWVYFKPYFQDLEKRPIQSKQDLERWLEDLSELEAYVSENGAWRQILVTRDTTNVQFQDAYAYFCLELEPKMKPYFQAFKKKLAESPFVKELDQSVFYPYLRSVENDIKLYHEENISIQAELNMQAQEYGQTVGKMTVNIQGKEYTLQQAARLLHEPDRTLREEAFRKIAERRLQDKDALNKLFDSLLEGRHKIAQNAGYENYRDYKFAELGRFDYGTKECLEFHEAVKTHVLPVHRMLVEARKQRLGLDVFRPWDGEAEPAHVSPLKPFTTGEELIQKSIEVLQKLRPFFGSCLEKMQEMSHLDLESRKGKAPGGYNCPLAETGVPFIFMNAAGTINDVITMMHESGHAIHSFLCHPLKYTAFKEYPMEMAELASMSMELFSMDHWDVFFPASNDLKRAKMEELERVISVLPWIATIDKFQHWLYTNPGHSVEDREKAWMDILTEFSTGVTDWSGFEEYRASLWQKQLHLFEVPFYYIEYGIAQLGAIAMWRQYLQNKEQALDNYEKALSLGYTKTLKELYETAGIRFDFSPAYVKELTDFIQERIKTINA
jgi:oligoendopeptidase F